MTNPGLGDVIDNDLRQTLKQWEHLGRRPYIVSPRWIPKEISGMAPQQELIDYHLVPRLWQLLADFPEILKRHTLRVQQPGWLEAPATSEPEDICSEDPVALSNGTPVTVISYEVPDRHVASFRWFGQLLDVAAQWGTVEWTIKVNDRPVRSYQNFKQQRGVFAYPTRLAAPIKLKSKDTLIVEATGGATAVNALARIQGWVMAATSVTQDGTYKDWNAR
jgi:hypothetical protein